jgi:hypothetical protein
MLRHAGLSEQRIDRARAILDRSYRAYTAVVPVVGIMVISAHGSEAAGQSPFPATIL